MNEYQKMSISELKAEIVRCPCAHGKCYTDPRYHYALRLWDGDGIAENKIEAFYYFKEAADYGHECARIRVGICYYTGEGITKSYENALEYFSKYKEKIDELRPMRYLWMGKCYLKIKERNKKKALDCFNEVANDHRKCTLNEESHKEALFFLGLCHYKGLCVIQNFEQAFRYFEKAAIGNSPNLGAQYYLVKCFRDGSGTQQNTKMAAYWSLKCFEREYDKVVQESMNCLGITT